MLSYLHRVTYLYEMDKPMITCTVKQAALFDKLNKEKLDRIKLEVDCKKNDSHHDSTSNMGLNTEIT